jgi:hypothetical protein
MRRTFYTLSALLLLFLPALTGGDLYSQTTGTLNFSVTTTSTGGYSPRHFLAIWIETNGGSFVKTNVAFTNSGDLDHMQTWVQKSGENVVDAATGGTITSHGTVTFLWNGTDVSGSLVADGSYLAWLEMAWASSLSTGKTVNSFPFTKGSTVFQSNPSNFANLLNVSLTWTPSTVTGIEGLLESKEINVYPNPSSGILNIDFKKAQNECLLQLMDGSGRIAYSERLTDIPIGLKTFSISSLPDGTYFCNLRFRDKVVVFTLILAK